MEGVVLISCRILHRAAYLPAFLLLALLLMFPKEAAEGARSGLSVCAGVIVPSLFPFLILSSLLSSLGLPSAMARITGPLMNRLSLPPAGAAPLLVGLCGGYPVGARAVAELVHAGTLQPEEGERMLPWCNNTGPGFIIGVAGSAVFGSVRIGILLYFCHILASLMLALLIGRKRDPPTDAPALPARPAGPEILSASVSAAVGAALDICGCVVFFSTLTALLRGCGLFSALAGALSERFGAELRWTSALLSGILELGTGISSLRGMAPGPAALSLAAFLLGFGGLSVHAQTLSALAGTRIRSARHFAGRILHGLLSAALVLLYFALMRLRI